MSNVVESKNNLIKHKLGILRDKNTGTKEFREIIQEIGAYLCYEALNDIELEQIEIETPVSKTKVGRLREDNSVFIPILRAGLGMTDGVLRVIPNAKFGHIGMYRDEKTFEIKSVAIPLT